MKPVRIAAVLFLAFLVGSGSAEVAVQTGRALKRARAEREVGSAGDLVALEVLGEDGAVVARPRLIAPPGRPAQLLLRDAADPGLVRLALRVETTREPSGDIALEYAIEAQGMSGAATGRVSVSPGVEHALDLGDAPLRVTLLALPVPSAAVAAYLEAEGARRAPADAI